MGRSSSTKAPTPSREAWLRQLPDVVRQPADALAKVLVRAGQTDAYGALRDLSECAPRRHRHAPLAQQLEREIARAHARGRHVGHAVERPLRFADEEVGLAQDVDDRFASPKVCGVHLAHAILWAAERGLACDLRDRRHTGRVGLQYLRDRVHELRRPRDIAQAPSGHRVRLGEREHRRDPRVIGRNRRGALPLAVEQDLVVALVAQQPQVVALRNFDQALGDRSWIYRAGWVAWTVDQQQLGARGDEPLERVEVGDEPTLWRARIEHATRVRPRQHDPRVRPAGVGQQHLVAGLQHRGEHRGYGANTAWRGGDAIGCDANAVHTLQLVDELVAQRDQALRVRVERLAVVDRALAGLANVLGRREVGLSDVQLDRARRAPGLVADLADARMLGLGRAVSERGEGDASHFALHANWRSRGA